MVTGQSRIFKKNKVRKIKLSRLAPSGQGAIRVVEKGWVSTRGPFGLCGPFGEKGRFQNKAIKKKKKKEGSTL